MKKSEHAVADWAKLVQSAQREPLSMEEMHSLLSVLWTEDKFNSDENLKRDLERGQVGFASAFWNRAKALGIGVSPSLAMVVGSYSHNFGVVAMIAAYLKWWCHENDKTSVSLMDWCMDIFPVGYPSEKTWEKLWDEQKCYDRQTPLDNLLDDRTCYGSLNV